MSTQVTSGTKFSHKFVNQKYNFFTTEFSRNLPTLNCYKFLIKCGGFRQSTNIKFRTYFFNEFGLIWAHYIDQWRCWSQRRTLETSPKTIEYHMLIEGLCATEIVIFSSWQVRQEARRKCKAILIGKTI